MLSSSRMTSLTGARSAPVDCPEGSLRRRIEGAQALDFVAEQIDAQRLGAAGRKHVDDAAADRIIAGFGDRLDADVAVRLQKARRDHRHRGAPRRPVAGGRRTKSRAAAAAAGRRRPSSARRAALPAPAASAANVSMRRLTISGLGETRSNGRQSQAGSSSRTTSRCEEGESLGEAAEPDVVAGDDEDAGRHALRRAGR